MTKQEHELNDHLLEMGWKAGAATPERVASLIERLSMRNKLKMAAVAIADTDLNDFEEIDILGKAA